jgi:hypothetical protein
MSDSTLDNPLDERSSPVLAITELGLSARASKVLVGAGINTVGDALDALEEGDEALIDLKGFGPKSLADLKTRLEERGFWPVQKDLPPLEALGETLGEELRELEALETTEAAPMEPALEQEATPRTCRKDRTAGRTNGRGAILLATSQCYSCPTSRAIPLWKLDLWCGRLGGDHPSAPATYLASGATGYQRL